MAWTFVNAGGTQYGQTTSGSHTAGWASQSGDLVVMPVWWYGFTNGAVGTQVTGTPSDNSGDGVAWNVAAPGGSSWNGGFLSCTFYWKVIRATGSFIFTITNINPSGSNSAYTSISVAEYTPPAGTVALDGYATANGTNAASFTTSTPTLTTTGASDLIVSLVNENSNRTHTAGTGFTRRVDLTNGSDEPGAYQDQLGAAAGTYTGAWALGATAGGGIWLSAMAAFTTTTAPTFRRTLFSLAGSRRVA